MKKFSISLLALCIVALVAPLQAQSTKGQDVFKKHVNKMVETVEKTESTVEKRTAINESLNDLISTIDRIEGMKTVSEADKEQLSTLRANALEKKNELNGLDGYNQVPGNQLSNFANFVQQDFEQADRAVTISVTTLLLVGLILLIL